MEEIISFIDGLDGCFLLRLPTALYLERLNLSPPS